MVIEALIFAYYKQNIKAMVTINSYNYVSSNVLLQLDNDKLLYYIVFLFKYLNAAEYN